MRLGSIQFLRMLAALLIACLHGIETQVYTPPGYYPSRPISREVGALGIGVDIFFVISGFIISLTAAGYNGRDQSLHFLKKRFIRLNPVYYIALLIFLALNIHHMLKDYVPGYEVFLKSVILLPLADSAIWNVCILPVAWTLNFEWYFYILFAIAIALPVKNKPRFLIALGIILVACYYIPGITDARIWFVTNPILLEFLMGAGIYLWYRHVLPSRAVAYGLLIGGVALYLLDTVYGSMFLNDLSGTAEGRIAFQRVLQMGIPAALIMSGCVFLEKNGLFLPLWNRRWVQLLGNASYSLYLTHYITYTALEALFVRIGPVMNFNLSIVTWFLIAVINGILFYRYVEYPLLQTLRRLPRSAGV
ncbi:acyltransferase family protein [Puia sp. P3]|uniref:acyltransferase family protein n=1 Tax=Puia sp. P3 TaxID=3423952 RepID=UPI003D672BE6